MSSRVSPWFLALLAVTVLGGFLAASATTRPVLTTGIVLLVLAGWAVSLCLHEFGHAYTAYCGGDRSVRAKGYLTLDIRRYANVGLSFVLPIVFLLLGGIPLPGGAVWIDQSRFWQRKGVRSLLSFAGPGTNLLIGIVISVIVVFVPMSPGLAVGLSALALIQFLAFVINILPVPGLDGYGVIEPYLSPEAQRFGHRVRPWAPLVLFLLVLGVPGVSRVLFEVGAFLFSAFGGDERYAAVGYDLLLFWR